MRKKVVLSLILIISDIFSLPQPLFYEPTWFIRPPRFERPWLFTANFMFRGGIGREAYNCQHNKTNVLSLYGPENIRELANGVPANQLGPNNFLNTLYTLQPNNPLFGTINWNGRFSTTQIILEATQNFKNGFFIQTVVPIRHMKISKITMSDNSTEQGAGAINYISWLQLYNNLPDVLTEYNVYINKNANTDFGNIQLLVGWTENRQCFDYIDYWDYSLITGVFFKNSSQITPIKPFLLSTGFDSHFSIPLSVNTAVGLYDWLTIGAHITGYFFKNNRQLFGVKSASTQNGWIQFAKEIVDVDKGNIYELGGYISADHILNGFTTTLGFSYAHEQPSTIHIVTNPSFYNASVANSSARLQSWSMVILHWYFEWDLATRQHRNMPQIALTVDVPIHGKRAFRTKMLGASMQWNFEY
jgi:hypothetical protein